MLRVSQWSVENKYPRQQCCWYVGTWLRTLTKALKRSGAVSCKEHSRGEHGGLVGTAGMVGSKHEEKREIGFFQKQQSCELQRTQQG
jgi:hypothetical protein